MAAYFRNGNMLSFMILFFGSFTLPQMINNNNRPEMEKNAVFLGNVQGNDIPPVQKSAGPRTPARIWESAECGNEVQRLCSPRIQKNNFAVLDCLQNADEWMGAYLLRKRHSEHSIIKANVNRSQALSDKPHEVWVTLLRANGTVVTGHCTCMAGLGEVCSHVVALLFEVEACTRLGFNKASCTSIPCQWNQNFTKKVSAATLIEISFQKPRCDNFHNKMPTIVQNVEPTKFADTSSFLQKLRKTNANAVIFSITNPKPQPKLCGPSLPPVLSEFGILTRRTSYTVQKSTCQSTYYFSTGRQIGKNVSSTKQMLPLV